MSIFYFNLFASTLQEHLIIVFFDLLWLLSSCCSHKGAPEITKLVLLNAKGDLTYTCIVSLSGYLPDTSPWIGLIAEQDNQSLHKDSKDPGNSSHLLSRMLSFLCEIYCTRFHQTSKYTDRERLLKRDQHIHQVQSGATPAKNVLTNLLSMKL